MRRAATDNDQPRYTPPDHPPWLYFARSELGGKRVSPIGGLLSQTAKSKSDAAYEWVMNTLREIDFQWYMGED